MRAVLVFASKWSDSPDSFSNTSLGKNVEGGRSMRHLIGHSSRCLVTIMQDLFLVLVVILIILVEVKRH